ncbi:hypothetical protein [Amycolatopsis panacis]|uniref:hypothetical protein n=1 Tax=Amycolatopsis panacis TaxID=2340917 RepID=UPI0011C3D980|nr:hypothetical protein [Amycolatopsis panacis]
MTGTRVLTIEMATAFTELPTDCREPNHPIHRPGYPRTYATATKRTGKTTMGAEPEVSTPVSTARALIIEMMTAFTELPTGDTELPTDDGKPGDSEPGDSEPDDVGSMMPGGRHRPGDASCTTPAGQHQPGDTERTTPARKRRPGSISCATPAGQHRRGSADWADKPIHGRCRWRACSGRPPAQVVANEHARVIEMGEKMKQALA